MTIESILFKLYTDLQLEAYNEETYSYDYETTNQIIRKNIEALSEFLKLNKSDVSNRGGSIPYESLSDSFKEIINSIEDNLNK
jgi:hypothetical protein